jgi:hypothetical protein
MNTDEALHAFFAVDLVRERYAALKRLAAERAVSAALRDSRLDQVLEASTKAAIVGANEERLLAISILMRLQAHVRSARDQARFAGYLTKAVAEPPPRINILTDPDDRTYVVRAMEFAHGDWVTAFLAEFIIEEEAAETARAEAVRVLVKALPSVDPLLQALAGHLEAWKPETQRPTESLARRVVRILQALEDHLADGTEATWEACRALARMVRPRSKTSPNEVERDVIEQVAARTLRLTHTLVRIRFSLAADDRAYEPVVHVREWFQPHQWARFLEQCADARPVVRDLREAILLLARQGRTDQQLMKRLELVSGSEAAAQRILAQLAGEPGVPPEVQAWLIGTVATHSPGGERSALLMADREASENLTLGELLRLCGQVSSASAHVERSVLPELDILAPDAAPPIRSLSARAADLSATVLSFASQRRLKLRGQPGEVVEFSPVEHEMMGGPAPGVRWVRLVQPAVEQRLEGGATRLVLRALVEPSREPRS